MIPNSKTILKKFKCIMALIILASLALIVRARKDVALPRLSRTEIIHQKVEDTKNMAVEDVSKREPSSASSDAKALADKEASAWQSQPEKILIDVPFTSQAPFGKWDAYHEEACEEASLLMVAYFAQSKKLTPAIAEKEIQALIAYEIKNTEGYEDSTAVQTAKLGRDYYGLKNLRVVYDFTTKDLKEYLAKGKPIIIPVAGRLLGNPNFTAPGPLYHNLVLIGYDGNTIITNDPGTRNGQGYRYQIKTIYNAIHDFSGDKNKIETGQKAMIVVE